MNTAALLPPRAIQRSVSKLSLFEEMRSSILVVDRWCRYCHGNSRIVDGAMWTGPVCLWPKSIRKRTSCSTIWWLFYWSATDSSLLDEAINSSPLANPYKWISLRPEFFCFCFVLFFFLTRSISFSDWNISDGNRPSEPAPKTIFFPCKFDFIP